MTSLAVSSALERLRTRPLKGLPLAALVGLCWLLGAVYCSGYERLLSGLDNWPGSLVWSAVAVLPWLFLFEWSKGEQGRRLLGSGAAIVIALVTVTLFSLLLEQALRIGKPVTLDHLLLSLMRRLPAAGTSLLLILWSRASATMRAAASHPPQQDLAALASSIDWIETADNYVELHLGQRTLMLRMTLADAEQQLAKRGFVRIHRRYLVNRSRLSQLTSGPRPVARLEDGTELPVGTRYAANLSSHR